MVTMHWSHVIFSPITDFFDFWVPPPFPVMTTSLWVVFAMSHKIPFHPSYVAIPSVLCISEEKKTTMQTAGTDVQNGLAPYQTAMTFYRTAFRAHKFCCSDRADRVGIRVLQADLPLLCGEESHVELRLEKGGRRKQSLRAALTRALHMALPQPCLLFCLDKKIWDICSLKPADPRVLCCISSESSAQCKHILPSKGTVLLLLVKIAWHTCHSSCTE